jgi:hypothetical protein
LTENDGILAAGKRKFYGHQRDRCDLSGELKVGEWSKAELGMLNAIQTRRTIVEQQFPHTSIS